MQQKTVSFKGQTFHLTAIGGGLACDYSGRITSHLMAGVAQIPGLSLGALMGGLKDDSGKPVDHQVVLLAMLSRIDGAAIGSAIGAIASRLPHTELKWLRELFLSTATVDDANGIPAPFMAELEAGRIKGGAITFYFLLGHAIELSIFPFSDPDASAPPPPPLVGS